MKVLVIRFSSIGDIVLTSPVIRCLKKQINAEVHYLTKPAFKDVLIHNPYIDKIHFLSENFFEQVKELKSENFDYIIDLHHNLRSLKFKKALAVRSYSFNKLNWKKWLMVNFKWNQLPKKHIVDRYLETCSKLGVKNDMEGLDYFISEKDAFDLTNLPENFRKDYVGLVIGAQHATKRLPKHKLLELCTKIQLPIILLGGKDDARIADELVKSNPEKILSACGKFPLNQSAYLVKNAKYIISHDTGLMHIAAAFKKEVFSIWGNTIPEFGMYPYKTEYHSLEVNDLNCRPCSKIGYNACPKKHFNCMNKQNFDSILEKIQ